MNSGKTIFFQLMDFLSPYAFRQCVQRYNGNCKHVSKYPKEKYKGKRGKTPDENRENGNSPVKGKCGKK